MVGMGLGLLDGEGQVRIPERFLAKYPGVLEAALKHNSCHTFAEVDLREGRSVSRIVSSWITWRHYREHEVHEEPGVPPVSIEDAPVEGSEDFLSNTGGVYHSKVSIGERYANGWVRGEEVGYDDDFETSMDEQKKSVTAWARAFLEPLERETLEGVARGADQLGLVNLANIARTIEQIKYSGLENHSLVSDLYESYKGWENICGV
jgi:hypothetical protein